MVAQAVFDWLYRKWQDDRVSEGRRRGFDRRLPHTDTPVLDLLARQIDRVGAAPFWSVKDEADRLIDIIAALACEYERRLGEVTEDLRRQRGA